MESSLEQQMDTFTRGIKAFENFFGYKARSHSSPHNLSGKFLVDIVSSLGFLGIDSFVQQESEIVISKFNRVRFDPFTTDFDWEKYMEIIRNELDTKNQAVLAYHAQNTFDTTYSPEKHTSLLNTFAKTVETLRKEYQNVVFVTSNELHQIQTQGWSEEIWYNHFVYRNYNGVAVNISIKNLQDVYHWAPNWNNRELKVEDINGLLKEKTVKVGDLVDLLPHITYKVSLKDR